MDAEEIIAEAERKYSTCSTYKDRGCAVFSNEKIEFSTLFMRPEHFYFHFQDYGPRRGKEEKFSTIWSENGETVFRWVRANSIKLEVVESLYLAIARGVGCSAGAAGIVLDELLPTLSENKTSFLRLHDFRLIGSESVGEIDCYVITGIGTRSRENKIWIAKHDFSVRRFFRDLSSTASEQNAEMQQLFENTELMALLREKGIAPPTAEATADHVHHTEYLYTEAAFDEDFEFPGRPV